MSDIDQERYDKLLSEYHKVMYQSTWRIAWNFFFLFVGLLPLMYIFIWIIGPTKWELTLFEVPTLMLVGSLFSLMIVVALLVKIYRDNLKLDERKRHYLKQLELIKSITQKNKSSF